MDGSNREVEKPGDARATPLLIALCAIAASTMLVEIVIVKFIAFKVYHHFINIIISTVVLSFAAAGTTLFVAKETALSEEHRWQLAARDAALYAVTLVIAVLLFCWIPLDPYNKELGVFWRLASLPFYFLLLSCPFFFGGLCISRILAESHLPPSRVFLFDLLAAAAAAAAGPLLLESLGGYGAIGASGALGMLAYFAFQKASGKSQPLKAGIWSAAFAISLAALLAYPGWAMPKYCFDIRSTKHSELRDLLPKDFTGIDHTYWNALARIDVSKLGWSQDDNFLFGFAPIAHKTKYHGRIITVDCGANTRQLVADKPAPETPFLRELMLSFPYIVRPDTKDTLILGGGGGLDISVAKAFKIPRIDVVEMNPMTYKHVLLGEGDADFALYKPWIESDATSKVTMINKEARHFCSVTPPGVYDVIQASGVDTLTAIASGALAFSDNYLYTTDAIESYLRVLKDDGQLSLMHWRDPPAYPLRLFATYLACLEKMGVDRPYRNIAVVGSDMGSLILKKKPFTHEELERVRKWCKETGIIFVFDPERSQPPSTGLQKDENLYNEIAFADPSRRKEILSSYTKNITPVDDDRPYFYQVNKKESWLFSSELSYTPIATIFLISIFAAVLITVPITRMQRGWLTRDIFAFAVFFAMCGFSFLLFEISIVQLFSIFVGGPVYAMAVVLVSVLAGYSVGCFIVGRLAQNSKTFLFIGLALFLVNLAAFLWLPGVIRAFLSLSLPGRITFCALITLFMSAIAGMPVTLAMDLAKKSHEREVAWFWGINCAFNALGSACFPLITLNIGIKATLAIVATLYLLANGLIALLTRSKHESTAESTTLVSQ